MVIRLRLCMNEYPPDPPVPASWTLGQGIVKRGNLCMGAECKDGVVSFGA